MPIRSLHNIGGDSVGIVLPKDDLRELGLIGDDGSIPASSELPNASLRYDGGAGWDVVLLDEDYQPKDTGSA